MTTDEVKLAVRGTPYITCGRCHQSASVDDWCRSPWTGVGHPYGVYQCPSCRYAFERRWVIDDEGRAVLRCVEVQAVL